MAISLTDAEVALLRDALIEYEFMTKSYAQINLGPYSNHKGWKHTSAMVKILRYRIEHHAIKERQKQTNGKSEYNPEQ